MWIWLSAGALVIALVWLAYYQGRHAQNIKNLKGVLKSVEKANKAVRNITTAKRDKLRRKWRR